MTYKKNEKERIKNDFDLIFSVFFPFALFSLFYLDKEEEEEALK